MTIDTSKYTAHSHPGKFEGETAATEYFWEHLGEGETVWYAGEGEDTCDEPCAEVFQIDAEESEAFGLPIGAWFMVREDSQGFVYGTVHATREQAERKFRSWYGEWYDGEE